MVETQRRHSFVRQGLWFALLPAVLFVPGVGFFTLCPPSYAGIGVRLMLTIFLASELWAIRKLVPALNMRRDGKVDALNLLVWAACTVAVAVSLVSLLGLLGYPRPD